MSMDGRGQRVYANGSCLHDQARYLSDLYTKYLTTNLGAWVQGLWLPYPKKIRKVQMRECSVKSGRKIAQIAWKAKLFTALTSNETTIIPQKIVVLKAFSKTSINSLNLAKSKTYYTKKFFLTWLPIWRSFSDRQISNRDICVSRWTVWTWYRSQGLYSTPASLRTLLHVLRNSFLLATGDSQRTLQAFYEFVCNFVLFYLKCRCSNHERFALKITCC